MIRFKQKGDFKKLTTYLTRIENVSKTCDLNAYGRKGVEALSSATPVDTGKTADSWDYKITVSNGVIKISWYNSNIQNGVPIAVIIQYGHATRNGGFVQGRDYINPAIKPVFDQMANEMWREVTK